MAIEIFVAGVYDFGLVVVQEVVADLLAHLYGNRVGREAKRANPGDFYVARGRIGADGVREGTVSVDWWLDVPGLGIVAVIADG